MKLCTHGDSLRFRLNRSDVEQFRQYQRPSRRNVNSRKAGLRRRVPLLGRRICCIDAAVHGLRLRFTQTTTDLNQTSH